MQNITIQSHFEYDELSVPLAFITIHSHSHSSSCQSLSLLLNRLPLSLFRSVCVSVLFLFVSFLREARVLCAYITRKNQQQQDISYNTCIQSGFRLKHHFRNPNQRHFINRFHPKKKKKHQINSAGKAVAGWLLHSATYFAFFSSAPFCQVVFAR